MKSIKVLCTVGLLALFFSCTEQEESVTFFIDNQLNENLIIERVNDENTPNGDIYIDTPIDLRASESFDKYMERLRDLDVKSLNLTFSNYEGQIQNGRLFLDNVYLGNFEGSMSEVEIQDPEILRRIEELFLERTELDFSFVGESNSDHFLSVQIRMSMQGTFVH